MNDDNPVLDHDDEDNATTTDDKGRVRDEITRIREFLGGVSGDDLRSGNWFEKLLAYALTQYAKEVNAEYFRTKYPHLPPDAIADARIKLAANYASIEGGLSAAAYTGTIAATLGSAGGASPLALPAAGTAFVIDLTYTSQLQIKLAHDLAVIYNVPLDHEDPEDLWKLVRIAFAIKGGEVSAEAALKSVPLLVRPVVKKVVSGSTLASLKSLPVVGKYLLQRNVVKFSIPGVGVPLTIAVNYWSTRVTGRQAREMFRREARLVECATRSVSATAFPDVLPWVLLLSMRAGGTPTADQSSLLHYTSVKLSEGGVAQDALDAIRTVVEVDETSVWSRLDELKGAADLAALYEAGRESAAIRGKLTAKDHAHLSRLAARCGTAHDGKSANALAATWR